VPLTYPYPINETAMRVPLMDSGTELASELTINIMTTVEILNTAVLRDTFWVLKKD
jgi:hypothetical protein